MRNMPKFWDVEALDDCAQAAYATVRDELSDEDWQRATIHVARARSDKRGLSRFCTLPACRRARRCRGNPTVCLSVDASTSASVQNAIDRVYVTIQEQRSAIVTDGRRLDLLDLVTRPARRRKRRRKRRRNAQPVIARRLSSTPIGDDRATQ